MYIVVVLQDRDAAADAFATAFAALRIAVPSSLDEIPPQLRSTTNKDGASKGARVGDGSDVDLALHRYAAFLSSHSRGG